MPTDEEVLEMLDDLHDVIEFLDDWEQDFLTDINDKYIEHPERLTEKQRNKIKQIWEREI
jgi:hypothetical protein